MIETALNQSRLLVSMPLLFRRHRLHWWFDQIRCLVEMQAIGVFVHVITSTYDPAELNLINSLLKSIISPGFEYEIESFWNPENPTQMTWMHKRLFDQTFFPDRSFTHFLYLEDDIRFTNRNLIYWLTYRERLRAAGLIPSFMRYEFNALHGDLRLSDSVQPTACQDTLIEVSGEYFVTPDNPYCAMYLLDRDLAEEYRKSRSFDPESSKEVIGWPETERSAMGLCFEAIPEGRTARTVVAFDLSRKLPYYGALVHHLPNNFTSGETPTSQFPFGSLRLLEAFR